MLRTLTLGFGQTFPIPEEIQPLISILKFKFSQNAIPGIPIRQALSPIEQQLVSVAVRFHKQELDRIRVLALEGNSPLDIMTKKVQFGMLPNLDILKEVVDFLRSNKPSEIIIYGVFYQCLAWVATPSCRECEFFLIAMSIINEFISVETAKDHSIEITFIVKLLWKACLRDSSIHINDTMCAIMCAHLLVNKTITGDFSDLFCDLSSRIFQSENKGSIVHLLRITQQFVVDKRPFVIISDGSILMSLLSNLVQELDVNAIELICLFAKPSMPKSESITELFAELPVSIADLIKLDDPTYPMFDSNDIDGVEINQPVLTCKFEDIPEMQYNSEIPIHKYADHTRTTKELTPPCFYKAQLYLLAQSFEDVSINYIKVFMTKYAAKVKENLGNQYYLDIYATFLFFCEALSDHLSLSLLSDALLSPMVLNREFTIFGDIPPIINTFREALISVVIKWEKVCADILCYCAKQSPWLFAEFVVRILANENIRLELFCSEHTLVCLMASAISLQQIYKRNPTENCVIARSACLMFIFKLVKHAPAFMIASALPSFGNGLLHFLFEPAMSKLIIDVMKDGFMSCKFPYKQPIFTQVVMGLCSIIDVCAENKGDEAYDSLASSIFDCVGSAITNNTSLVHSFAPMLMTLLRYVSQVPKIELLNTCFAFLSMLSMYIENFRFSTDVFMLLADMIFRADEDELTTIKARFPCLLSGSSNISYSALIVIKHHIFIPLMVVAYSRSQDLSRMIEYFTSLCNYSPANCIACHDGDLDFLLLELILNNHCVKFYGYTITVNADDSEIIPPIMGLVNLIIKEKTSSVVCERLFRLILPNSQYFSKTHIGQILDVITSTRSHNMQQKNPVFNLYPSKVLCEVTGLTESDVNANVAISFWVNVDLAQVVLTKESFDILKIVAWDNSHYIRVYVNNARIVVAYGTQTRVVSAVFKNSVTSNKWTNYSILIRTDISDSLVQLFEFNNFPTNANFPKINFPAGPVKFIIGGDRTDTEPMDRPAGMIGPFCHMIGVKDDSLLFTYPFEADPNFERIQHVLFSSHDIAHPRKDSRVSIIVYDEKIDTYGFLSTLAHEYDLNYVINLLNVFNTKELDLALSFLEIVLGCLACYRPGQNNFYSIPLLVSLLTKVFNSALNYKFYSTFFNFLSECSYEKLQTEVFNDVILNINLWIRADTQSVLRIIDHWNTHIVRDASFKRLFTERWTVTRIIGQLQMLFWANKAETVEHTETEIGIQVSLDNDVYETSVTRSCLMYHNEEETMQIRDAYLKYIIAVASVNLTHEDVHCIYSCLFNSERKEDQLVYLDLVKQIGCSIARVEKLRIDPIVPLQSFFNTQDVDLITAGVLALCNVAGDNVHFALSEASIQILTNANTRAVFERLLCLVDEQPNVYSLICALALTLEEKYQRKALDVLHILTYNGKQVHSKLAVLWPLALGIISDEEGQAIISDFVSRLVINETALIESFDIVLYLIGFLANGWLVQASKLASDVTRAIVRDVAYSRDTRSSEEVSGFVAACFRSVFCQSTYSVHNRVLMEAFDDSPFSTKQKKPPTIKPIDTFLRFTEACMNSPLIPRLRFALRVDDEGNWIDHHLVLSILSLLETVKYTDPILSHYEKVSEYFHQRMNGTNQSLEICVAISSSVEEIVKQAVPFDPTTLHTHLRKLSIEARSMISEAISGLPDNLLKLASVANRTENKALHNMARMARENEKRVLRDIVYQRDSSLFLAKTGKFFYQRDDASCYAFCPTKLEPYFDEQKKGYKYWDINSETDKQTQTTRIPSERRMSSLGESEIGSLIKPDGFISINFKFGTNRIYIEYEETGEVIRIEFTDVEKVFTRPRFQKTTAIEMFLIGGVSYFIDFGKSVKQLLEKFQRIRVPIISISDITEEWTQGKMSNFCYLMHVNMLSGRSFNDVMQYPIMPNLMTENGLRDLTKPIQNCSPEFHPIENPIDFELNLLFHESALSPEVVDSSLSRIEPFSSIHIHNHGSKNLSDEYSNAGALTESELPPEFFYQAEAFTDVNECGFRKFSSDSPRIMDHIYKMRKLLESRETTEKLNQWIDMIFGYLQKGDDAHRIGNFYHPYILDTVWECESSSQINAGDQAMAMMTVYGAMPMQIFTEPHPHRLIPETTTEIITSVISPGLVRAVVKLDGGNFWAIEGSGKITPFKINLSASDCFEKLPALDYPLDVFKKNKIVPLESGVLVYDSSNNRVMIASQSNKSTEFQLFPVDQFTSSGPIFVTLSNRTSISVFDARHPRTVLGHVATTEDVIECLALNYSFHLLCIATRDQRLHFMSLKDNALRQTMVVEMALPSAKRILISNVWGFVVVDFGRELHIFSVNGAEIGKFEHKYDLAYWTTVSSRSDFDYLVFVDLKGDLCMFDIYEPSSAKKLVHIPWPVCFIDYDRSNDVMIIVSTNGKTLLITSPFNK